MRIVSLVNTIILEDTDSGVHMPFGVGNERLHVS